MLQPKEDLKLTKQEQDRNASVTKQSTTKEFAKNIKETQGLEMDNNGKAKPIIQKRKIQFAKPGSGKKTRIIGEDGSILHELEPGSEKEKLILRRVKNQESDTNKRRQHNTDVVNYQTGDTDGNKVYEKKLAEQGMKVKIKKS